MEILEYEDEFIAYRITGRSSVVSVEGVVDNPDIDTFDRGEYEQSDKDASELSEDLEGFVFPKDEDGNHYAWGKPNIYLEGNEHPVYQWDIESVEDKIDQHLSREERTAVGKMLISAFENIPVEEI